MSHFKTDVSLKYSRGRTFYECHECASVAPFKLNFEATYLSYVNSNTSVHLYVHCVVSVGCYHRDGRAEQTHTHLPGLPCHGTKPEQLASLRVDPAAGCSEGLADFLKWSSLKILASFLIQGDFFFFNEVYTGKGVFLLSAVLECCSVVLFFLRCTWSCASLSETVTPSLGCLVPVRKPLTSFTFKEMNPSPQRRGFALQTTPKFVNGSTCHKLTSRHQRPY